MGIGAADDLAPRFRMRMLILSESRMSRLIEKREIDIGEIDELHIEFSVRTRLLEKPLSNPMPAATVAGTCDNDLKLLHVAKSR